MTITLRGIICATVTFFNCDYSLDESAQKEHMEFLSDSGVDAVLVLGSTGEFCHLTLEEQKRVLEICVDPLNSNKVRMIAGINSCSTDQAIDLAKFAQDIGADFLQIQAPFYYKYDEEALYVYFRTIASTVDIPVIIYNVPTIVRLDLSPRLIADLSILPNFVGLKDTTPNFDHMQKVLRLTKKTNHHFSVISGSDDLLLPILTIGGHGSASAIANFCPSLPVGLYKAYIERNFAKAHLLHEKIVNLRSAILSICRPPIPAIKNALSLIGRSINPTVRRPMPPLKEPQVAQLKAILENFELI